MSEVGALRRGKIWYKYRDVEGNYPKGIKNDPHKMEELNLYIDSIKPVKKEKK